MNQDNIKIVMLIVVFFVIAIYVSYSNRKKTQQKLLKRLKNGFGKPSARKYTLDELEIIKHFYNDNYKGKNESIDDITWNDLNMDRFFCTINNTNSSIGQEYLYKTLRVPEYKVDRLKEIDRLAGFFSKNESERINIQKILANMGYVKYVSASDYINLIVDLKPGKNLLHYISIIGILVSLVVCIFLNPVIGISLIILSIAFTITTYYKFKAKVESYFICISHVVRMLEAAGKIKKLNYTELSDYNNKLSGLCDTFSNITTNSWLLQSSNVNGSLGEVILDYLRMLFHIDLIKFNNMIKLLNHKNNEIFDLFNTLGFLEMTISVASFREMLPLWSIPEFSKASNRSIVLKDVYHPLITEPVANSLSTDKNVLLTGSNASGKSTFLKTVALNAVLSQTIYTSIASEYKAPFFRIYSSMSLRDDLENNNSYYMVEIKSLKRILDASTTGIIPVLCFVDEVLRGTNTVERIAASSEILRSMNNKDVLCFAATHDIELTIILDKYYDNYHFQEEVTNNDVKFNYKLFKGPATTRNAIKLLSIIGYEKNIIDMANKQAAYFLEKGIWKKY